MQYTSVDASVESEQPPVSLSHFMAILRAYSPVIGLTLLAVAIGYAILSVGLLLVAPSRQITTQPFRLDFRGAVAGQYPNGLHFSTADIVATPVLLDVYDANALSQFVTFEDFSHAIFVLEANPAYEAMASEYQARLADVKLSPIDRDRILKEFELKAASISKNEYSLNFQRMKGTSKVPESVARKVLVDVLSAWAVSAVKEHHVLEYQVSVLSPDALNDAALKQGDAIFALQILRSKINRVMENIEAVKLIPGAELLRTKERLSLEEIQMRLQELMRFQVEPLTVEVRSSGMMTNPAATVSFLETQLAYDQRELKWRQSASDTVRQALAVYSMEPGALSTAAKTTTTMGTETAPRPTGSETVMPQLGETFIDRLMTLSNQASDAAYRQTVVEQFRRAQMGVIPAQAAVEYDQQILADVKASHGGTPSPERVRDVQQRITAAAAETRQLVGSVNEIYQAVSRNLNPPSALYTLSTPPITRTERARDVYKLALGGLLALLITLPIVVIACLLHARIREEHAAETRSRTAGAAA